MRALPKAAGIVTVACGLLFPVFTPRHAAPSPRHVRAVHNPFLSERPVAESWPDDLFPHLVRSGFPMDRDRTRNVLEAVSRCAARFGLDPLAVLAVIEVESEFDPAAVSPVGAMGLMQLRPETGREIASELGIPWTSDDEMLFDPELNVLLGTCYLRRLLDRFGDLDAALAAFHTGPTRIGSRIGGSRSFSLRYPDRVLDALFELRSRLGAPKAQARALRTA